MMIRPLLLSRLQLLLEYALQCHRVGSKFRDTLPQFLHRHGLLIEIKSEGGFIVEIRLLFNVQCGGFLGIELQGHSVL